MDDKHRNVIKKNISKLVQYTNFKDLLKTCQEERLLSQQMVENLYLDSKNLYEFGRSPTLEEILHQKLFEKIIHRGPEAFQKLIKILRYLDNVRALQILESEEEFCCLREKNVRCFSERSRSPTENPIQQIPISVPVQTPDIPNSLRSKVDENARPILEEYSGPVSPKQKYEVKKADRIHTNELIDTYKMESKENRGVLFIANFINTQTGYRNGAINDSYALIYVFKQLGFKIFVTTDSSQKEFFDLLEQLLKSDYTRKTECFILALMSHGELNSKDKERIEFSDGSVIKVEEIRDRFSNKRCPNLVGKPKVLIFPFCRGYTSDSGVQGKLETDSISSKDNLIPTMSDILICYATNPGSESHRDPDTGSWYIQELCKNIAQHAHDTHFEDIIQIVQAQVGSYRAETIKMQMGNSHNIGFNYKLFFNPGYPID
ncbi:caspase Dronc-like [Anastrepha obliqua]|uniref:caspase Dronc-like n=1 Tax=Anastrepha obliqua TaxID=95512 RepID=UPI0024098055|nr:caspase Dronc-like [Anastrepha obliqua]